MTKYNDYLMLAGKDRRVTDKKASRRNKNRFGRVAASRNKIREVPAESFGKNRFCHMAARKHRFGPMEATAPLPNRFYGMLAGREKRIINDKAPKAPRNGFSRVAVKGSAVEGTLPKGNERNRFSMNVRSENRVKQISDPIPSEGYTLLAGRDRRLMNHPQRKQYYLLAGRERCLAIRPERKQYHLLGGRDRRLMLHPQRKRYHLLAGRDRRLPIRSQVKKYRLLGGRSRHFRTIWLPMLPAVVTSRQMVPVGVARKDLAIIGGRPYGWIHPFLPIDKNETVIGG